MSKRLSGAIWFGIGVIVALAIYLPHPYRQEVINLFAGDPTLQWSKRAIPVKYVPLPPILIGIIYLWQGRSAT